MSTPAERAQRARIAAHAMHAKHDPVETTKKARDAFLERFLDQVDPDGELRLNDPAQARRRAASERKRYFAQLAFPLPQPARRTQTRQRQPGRRRTGGPPPWSARRFVSVTHGRTSAAPALTLAARAAACRTPTASALPSRARRHAERRQLAGGRGCERVRPPDTPTCSRSITSAT